jgi:glutaredoxin-like protein
MPHAGVLPHVPATDHSPTSSGEIVVYWRPGCPFCSSLRRGLVREGLPFREVDIWSDPEAAAFVRSVANGCETVPTVSIGSVHLVNPRASVVAEVAATELPDLQRH